MSVLLTGSSHIAFGLTTITFLLTGQVVAVFNDKTNELHRTNTVRLVLISLCIVIGVIVTITLGFVSGPVGFAVSLLVFAG
jgi:hypothetical protein